jgi:hypothetical protein
VLISAPEQGVVPEDKKGIHHMNREVKLVLILVAIIVFSVSTNNFVKQYVAVMQIERLNAPPTEVSEEPSGQAEPDMLTQRQKQERNQVLKALEQDHQAAEAQLIEAVNKQIESEEALLCPDDSETEQCS